jgi:ABC-2 type transport system ATP-binding protein
MIEAQSLTRHYGNTVAVDNVSFTIGDHQVVGLLGHNGAGKTTIMRMLSGYLEPTQGSILINGASPAGDSYQVQQSLGYLPENLPVYPQMLVADYLDYAATLKGIPAAQRMEEVRRVLVATDLSERALNRICVLSRGFRQRVGVAQAILGQPRLLILDEPTNGLDPNQTEHMRQLVRRLARRSTVILSTHIMQEVDAVCDRVLMLRNGRLVLDQSLADLHESKTLHVTTNAVVPELAAYIGRLPQVATLDVVPGTPDTLQFTIRLHSRADMDTAANNVAQCVIKAGAKLYQIQVLSRDLDSIFREVNTGGH